MVVGYVFGPKKMKSMSVVMAEASRAQVIHEDIHEEDEEDELFYEKDQHYQSSDKNPPISTVLTTEALERLEKSTTRNSTVINFGNFNKSDLKNVVRYFRSSSSTASTPTTIATTLTRSSRFPIRISFVPLDPDWPLEEQHGGNFDLILHKLTEDILSCSLGNATNDAKARVERLKDYQHRFPTCCMLDDPNSVMTVMSRCAISRKLQTCLKGITSASGLPVKAPKFVVINDNTSNVQEQLQAEQLSVPLIVKPLIAAGTKQSHYMTIVLQESATINRIPPNSIVQEYVNHDESLYKVYVMGTYVHVYKRTSLPNLPTDMASISTKDFVKFDSQHLYPSLQDFGITEAFDRTEQTPHDTSVTPDEVSPLVDVLKRAFGLDLFGFDILLSPQKEWLVVDVNYFPSYKEVPNFPNQLAQYLTRRVSQQRRHNLVTNISR
jgi:inositol-1,3,4-trisphosphate 5/6-kinase/inositol-tetrakisphosphate 1-kinase